MNEFQENGVAKALEPYMDSAPTNNVVQFEAPRASRMGFQGKPAAAFANLPLESLADGLETNIEEIRSAVLAIPPSAISTEPEWMKLARALAWEAALFPKRKDTPWEILDTASRRAPGYDKEDNQRRFDRYISEALDHENPITIATVFHMALEHGWPGRSPPIVNSANISGSEVGLVEGPPPAEPSFADPYTEYSGPAFPLDVLPPTLASFVDAEHRAMGADPAALAMAAITTVAGAIHAETRVRAGEGWWEKPILWTGLIGNPSTKKSPTIDKATKPLRRIDKERSENWRQQKATWKKLPKDQRGDPPSPPARCIVMDITPEKIAEILSRAPSGSLMVHDELAGWMDGFERYSSGGSSRAFHLQCWNGDTYVKDRVGKGANDPEAEICVDNLALCVLGGIQPDKLEKMPDLTSDGLLQRFLPILMRPAERGDEYHPLAAVEADYEKLIKSINDAPPQNHHFADEALEVRDRVNDYLHELEKVDGFSSALIGAIGKLRGYFARICLVLQVAWQHDPASSTLPDWWRPEWTRAEGERLRKLFKIDQIESLSEGLNTSTAISRLTAEAAEKLLRQFLLPQIFALYDVLVNGGKERDRTRAIADFILAANENRLRPSDFTAGLRALRGQPAQKVHEWVSRICAMGWLHPEDDKTPIPKAWLVAPGLREYFAERRKLVQAARAEAHKILCAGGSRPRA
jgi:hypothetical protein